jgi:hypothetical protein
VIAVNTLWLLDLRHTLSVLRGEKGCFWRVAMRYAGGALIENSLISAFFDDVAILIFFTVRVNIY